MILLDWEIVAERIIYNNVKAYKVIELKGFPEYNSEWKDYAYIYDKYPFCYRYDNRIIMDYNNILSTNININGIYKIDNWKSVLGDVQKCYDNAIEYNKYCVDLSNEHKGIEVIKFSKEK